MNSRWQANRIGLINFWYYDDQEFPFVKGRMLLRGSNGSGKSVTMQSVVPLLLDGNMSPERLDPFGSRDRKMSSYLLEEDDEREERTGYLFLEFKRLESDTYLTIGMGIRARKGKPLDKWYFSLSDGRRVGKDFLLYKETGEKITLSKKELENRVGQGGHVFDRQQEYMEYVNRHIFGFETVEEYKEMIDLLIQLRTPKLSKDFKPSVINEILSDSLQPLSDEDLRPMAEAIENMDIMNMNLKARTEGLQAAGKIQKVLGKYDRLKLYRKAFDFVENEKQLERLAKDEELHKQEAEECAEQRENLEKEQVRLSAKKEAMEKELDSLKKSDAVGLNDRKLTLEEQMDRQSIRLAEKERQLRTKEDLRIESEGKYKEEENRQYKKEQELKELLEEMQEEADDMSFQEHSFFQEEFTEDLTKEISFETHRKQFEETRNGIQKGAELLREVEIRRLQAEEALQRREKHQQETDAVQRRVTELEGVLIQVQEEWKEKLYSWNGSNTELRLQKELLMEFSSFADSYGKQSDFTEVKNKTADIFRTKKDELIMMLNLHRREKEEAEKNKKEWESELKEWENNREPEPERSDAVRKNRKRLTELNIPYIEFYKLLDFGKNIGKEECNRLEEALIEMGILDALVVDEQYKEKVLEADSECCDRYLFVGKDRVEDSILDILELDEEVNDIFLNQRVTRILSGIAYVKDDLEQSGSSVITSNGIYRIGAVTGTISGTHEAGFIGGRARERNRKAKIELCKEKIRELEAILGELSDQIDFLERREHLLELEYKALPDDTDMKEALRMLDQEEQRLGSMKAEGKRLEESYTQLAQACRDIRKEALELADKLYLACSYDVFFKAKEASDQYNINLSRLKSEGEMYRRISESMVDLQRRIESLDEDLDDIRYEKQTIERECETIKQEYQSVVEQLKLTDYEQIRNRLDQCMEWLKSFQGRMNACTEEKTRKEERIKLLQDLLEQDKSKIEKYRKRSECLQLFYEKEKELGYVELPGECQYENVKECAKQVEQYLMQECKEYTEIDILKHLNQVYYENRVFLNDYQPQQMEIFNDLLPEIPEGCGQADRIDITARYQGVQIPFHQLTDYLAKEIEELKELIKAGDRELFEDILANTVSRKIRGKINSSNAWVEKMNSLMGGMNTSSGLKLSLRWRSKTAETEDQMDTKDLVELLKKDYRVMKEGEASRLSRHFRSKVEEARRNARDKGSLVSFYQVMKETLDYRKWFEFQLFSQKSGERKKELTNSVFGTFSGGEKAMSMYVPLFSAVVAKYQGGNKDAPRLISLDEAFAGVDNRNIRDMFRLMTEFEFDFIINSQVLWGDSDTLDALAIYQLIRPENAKFVTVMPYLWNGKMREMLENEQQVEERAMQYE